MNRLADAHSPYLLQHADQPVDWYPWGDEAFEIAAREDKPVFLSIGYAACHWCHVMAHESFDDPTVAALMNDTFVCVKVDREEYPAVDNHYMAACHLMTGGGGWPLNVITTPDRVPFFAGTYIPRNTIQPRIGMLDLIPRIGEFWRDNRAELLETAGRVANAVTALSFTKPDGDLDTTILDRAYEDLATRYDAEHGGFDGAPKFPSPHNLLYLLRYWRRTGVWYALEMVEDTLDAIRAGGIHDHIGGGFHRYATDNTWTLPHFEKMLTDQAMLAIAFTETYHATGAARYEDAARDIIGYVLRDLAAPNGGFYTAEDADSTVGEGVFYLWAEDDLRALLEPEDAELAIRAYAVEPDGNYLDEATRHRTGLNVLHMPVEIDLLADEFGMEVDECETRLDAIRDTLFQARQDRPRPPLDDKVLTDANGLMIAALAYAARVFDDERWRTEAIRTADWVLTTMCDESGGLYHRHHRGHTGIAGTLDDYQFLVWGLIELYETTFDARYLDESLKFMRRAIARFGDTEIGGFYLTENGDTSLPVRRKDAFDGALPSGSSIAVLNLIRLAHLAGDPDLESMAHTTCRAFSAQIERSVSAYTMLLAGYGMLGETASEVVIAGDPDAVDTRVLTEAFNRTYLPDSVALLRPLGANVAGIDSIVKGLDAYNDLDDGGACAHVCRNRTCLLPTADPDEMISRLISHSTAE